MGKITDLYGVEKIEIGDPGDGIMGATLIEFPDVKEKSVSIDIPINEPKKIYTEKDRNLPYRTFKGDSSNIVINFALFGVELDKLPIFLGGTYDVGPPKKYIYPTNEIDIYQSIKITQRDTAEGKRLVHYFPYCYIQGGIEGEFTFDDLASLSVRAEVNIPISAALVKGDPYYIQEDET